jgi:hypothetical protein
MFSPVQLEVIYSFMRAFDDNPRITLKKLHKKCSSYRAISSTANLLKQAQDNQVFIGPRLFVNAHLDITLIHREDRSVDEVYDLWNETVADPKVRYAVMLAGAHWLLVFKRGATVLDYAEAVRPSFPAKKTLGTLFPIASGRLDCDPYPQGWNELDWKIYEYVKYPSLPFRKIGERLGVSWHTVKDHYTKIRESCKAWHSFFPKGLLNYYHAFISFKTDFEIGFRKELSKLDRTTFLYRAGKTVILYLALDDQRQINKFFDLQKEGIIHDLRVSTPIQWYKPDVLI